jgi:hypothetical protein
MLKLTAHVIGPAFFPQHSAPPLSLSRGCLITKLVTLSTPSVTCTQPSSPAICVMYERLESSTTIRLLEVQPGNTDDPLTCDLRHCDLRNRDIDSVPEYEDISYVWGDATLCCSVTCDAEVVPVTLSLHQALTRIRFPSRSRTVWIDGLCINQTDDAEKSL